MSQVAKEFISHFHFGVNTCAICLDAKPIQMGERTSVLLAGPVRGLDRAVLIPAGRQAFHEECYSNGCWRKTATSSRQITGAPSPF
jgi:hypothetical protein